MTQNDKRKHLNSRTDADQPSVSKASFFQAVEPAPFNRIQEERLDMLRREPAPSPSRN